MAKRGTRSSKAAGKGRRTGGGAGRKRSRSSGRASSRGGSARRASRAEAARQVTASDAGATELSVVMAPEGAEDFRASRGDGAGEAAAQAAAEEVPTLRTDEARTAREAARAGEAAAELERRREEAEAIRAAEERTRTALPGIGGMAVELLLGGMRLVRAIATAPLRIGLALLDRSA
jgi:hypothetical protein